LRKVTKGNRQLLDFYFSGKIDSRSRIPLYRKEQQFSLVKMPFFLEMLMEAH
jgi:hypothetical protein